MMDLDVAVNERRTQVDLESARAELENTEEKLSWALKIQNVPSVEARTCLICKMNIVDIHCFLTVVI